MTLRGKLIPRALTIPSCCEFLCELSNHGRERLKLYEYNALHLNRRIYIQIFICVAPFKREQYFHINTTESPDDDSQMSICLLRSQTESLSHYSFLRFFGPYLNTSNITHRTVHMGNEICSSQRRASIDVEINRKKSFISVSTSQKLILALFRTEGLDVVLFLPRNLSSNWSFSSNYCSYPRESGDRV